MSLQIGPYTQGEKPAPLTYQFLDNDGNLINLLGYSAKFSYQEHDGTATVANATVSDAANGKVTYTFTGAEFATAGHYRAQFWSGNGVNRLASVDLLFDVAVSVGAAPSI
jgi:hypothetical protein